MKFYINKSQFIQKTNKEMDGNNFLVAYDVPIAKTGIQQYTRAELGEKSGDLSEFVNVYRDPDVFEDEKLLETFDGIPIVYDHPDNGRVDNKNFKHFVVGTVSGPYFKDGHLFAKKLTIIDKEAIVNVLSKNTNELSIGFRGVVVKKKGKFNGVPYEYQEDVLHANHLALCETGKAGPFYAINSVKTKRSDKSMYSMTNSVGQEHERMREKMRDGAMPNVEGTIKQVVKEKMSHVKPHNFGDNMEKYEEDCMDSHHEEHLKDSEHEYDDDGHEEDGELKHHMKKEKVAEKHLEKKHAMDEKNSTSESLQEVEHEDKDVINSLKRANSRLKDLINSKNKEIRRLELANIQLDETLTEATEYMREMKSKLQSASLVNSLTAPDNLASPTHPKQRDLCNSITSSFLYCK